MKHQVMEKKEASELHSRRLRGKNRSREQDKTPVEVFCRLRPLKNPTDRRAIRATSDHNLQVSLNNESNSKQVYKFKHIFKDKDEQTDVFRKIGYPLVKKLFAGENGLLFTYGVTSAGKTYTITGTPSSPGLLPRVLDVVFNTLNKTELQSRKYSFKPDGHHGFEVESTPDAMIKIQNEQTNVKRQRKATDPTLAEWLVRQKEEDFVKDVNHDFHYTIFVSYVENYNKYIYDLLDDNQFDQCYPMRINTRNNVAVGNVVSKNLRENGQKQVFVQNVCEVEVRSAEEAFQLFIKGNQRRRMAATSLNAESSRSHSIFTIRLVRAPVNLNGTEVLPNPEQIGVSQLSIVDLAGCERTHRTGATGNRLKEAGSINNSLMILRNCFDALRENQKAGAGSKKLVPYRDSRLTHLFKSFFEGSGHVKMIICLNPGSEDVDETLNVLKFGELSQEILTSKGDDPLAKFKFSPGFKLEDFSLFALPSWPEKFIEDPADEKTIKEWQEIAQLRRTQQANFLQSCHARMSAFRERIVGNDQEITLFKEENRRLKHDLESREKALRAREEQLIQQQRDFEKSQRILAQQQEELRNLQRSISEEIENRARAERNYEKLKVNVEDYVENHRSDMMKSFRKLLKNKEEELQKMECLNNRKLELAANILRCNENDLFKNIQTPTHLIEQVFENQPTPKRRNVQTEVKRLNNDTRVSPDATTINQEAPVASIHQPVVNPKFGTALVEGKEKWIDHRPPGTIELGTVMQPIIKNAKSVTELKAKDFIERKSSKYVLTHHVGNSDGMVETQLFKGDVMPSSCGGAQVIFNDIEKLTQTSPTKKAPALESVPARVNRNLLRLRRVSQSNDRMNNDNFFNLACMAFYFIRNFI